MYVPTWVKHNKIPCRWMVYNKLQFLQRTSVVNCGTYICTYSHRKMLVYVCLVRWETRYITLFYIQRRTYAWLCASYKNGIREGQLRPILSRLKNVVFTFKTFLQLYYLYVGRFTFSSSIWITFIMICHVRLWKTL